MTSTIAGVLPCVTAASGNAFGTRFAPADTASSRRFSSSSKCNGRDRCKPERVADGKVAERSCFGSFSGPRSLRNPLPTDIGWNAADVFLAWNVLSRRLENSARIIVESIAAHSPLRLSQVLSCHDWNGQDATHEVPDLYFRLGSPRGGSSQPSGRGWAAP